MKKQMTIEQHKIIGKNIRSHIKYYQLLLMELQNNYTKKDTEKIRRVLKSINQLRCWLDDMVYDENPHSDSLKIYYGVNVPD